MGLAVGEFPRHAMTPHPRERAHSAYSTPHGPWWKTGRKIRARRGFRWPQAGKAMTFKSVETPEQLPLLAISLTDRCGSQHSYLLGTELAGANKIDEGFQ